MIAAWGVVVACVGCGGGAAEVDEGRPEPVGSDPASTATSPATPLADLPACGPPADAASPLPRMTEEERSVAYWLARSTDAALDRPLLSPEEIAAHDRAVGSGGDDLPFARLSLAQVPAHDLVTHEVSERLAFIRERLEDGTYVDAAGARISPGVIARFTDVAMPALSGELRMSTAALPLRCGRDLGAFYTAPTDGGSIDLAFDRNACSNVEAQELVQVLHVEPDGSRLVRTRYALGWVAADAPLSPPLTPANGTTLIHAIRTRPRAPLTITSDDGAGIDADTDVLLAQDPTDPARVLFATDTGLHRSVALGPDAFVSTHRTLTRRAFLEEAFRHLDEPYGWGGHDGGLDCSELVMDVLATFDLDMPRHSARQAEVGTFSIPIPEAMPEEERLAIADRALDHGVVLFHFPGHVMIYLGRNAQGQPRILHSFAEYLEPCATPEGTRGDLLRRVNRVTVSDLELGRDTARRAFVQRIDSIVVFGRAPEPDLRDLAHVRAALPVTFPRPERCVENVHARIFHSPAHPVRGEPLRILVTTDEDPGIATLEVIDRHGVRTRPEAHRLGGPPFAQWIEIADPPAGRLQIALGDGDRVVACDWVGILRFEPEPPDPATIPPPPYPFFWEPRISWEGDTEALFAAFVEQLFAFPEGDERTWSSLTELLRDREHNILYDHLRLGEDSAVDEDGEPVLNLVPDCADLPYFLRAYFAWKLHLPFGYRQCSRGRAGIPPHCEDVPHTSTMEHAFTNEVEAFQFYATHMIASGVHSATARTSPLDSDTDLYPIAMERRAITPGTVFADPYGHLIVVSQWIPERPGHWGSLMGADAQPDGTIGRRTFWRGTFLFTPDTRDVGAGFKAWRPIVYDDETLVYTVLPNEEIDRRSGFTPYSRDQYRGTIDDFYDRMEALIDPRPVDAISRQVALVDALEESVVRRVVSIDTGEAYLRAHPGEIIPMPDGLDIFQTEGAWEDFSTPSRDMRLLVAIDTVMGFSEALQRRADRFGVAAGDLDRVSAEVRARRDQELAARSFEYTGSDGQRRRVTLAEVVARSTGFEIAWNPNDCPEIRWGAPSGSDELRACVRHAPIEQTQRIESTMRSWFHARARPVR
jgi:cell wall-associated NlpC family hydrolase